MEILRATGSPVYQRIDELLALDLATCDASRMEVLGGARDEHHLQQLRRLLARAVTLPIERGDYETAAALYRNCRRQGRTVRRLIDCLIAAVAIRANVPILHRDADFDALAERTAPRVDCV